MAIAQYIKEIGRGKAGARSLSREQAADLMGQVLRGEVSDLELGGFCLAMRIKGESTDEMLGFLDAMHAQLPRLGGVRPTVVLPSYNGARKLPVLTPLLAGLLAQRGVQVLVHGPALQAKRTTAAQVWQALQWPELFAIKNIAKNAQNTATPSAYFIKTDDLSPGLTRLLAVRDVVGVRNSAHSLVKLMNPLAGSANPASHVVVGSYTHPEYLELMSAVFAASAQQRAMLLRGTEGEPVADARRCPQMTGFVQGARSELQAAQDGALLALPELPQAIDAASTAAYTQAVLAGVLPVPAPIATQVERILHLLT